MSRFRVIWRWMPLVAMALWRWWRSTATKPEPQADALEVVSVKRNWPGNTYWVRTLNPDEDFAAAAIRAPGIPRYGSIDPELGRCVAVIARCRGTGIYEVITRYEPYDPQRDHIYDDA